METVKAEKIEKSRKYASHAERQKAYRARLKAGPEVLYVGKIYCNLDRAPIRSGYMKLPYVLTWVEEERKSHTEIHLISIHTKEFDLMKDVEEV